MQAFVGIVLGQRGAGKSWFLSNNLLPMCPAPVFVLDTLGGDFEYGLHFWDCDAMANGFLYERNDSGVYVLRSESDAQSSAFFRTIHAIGKEKDSFGIENLTIVVDEVDKFCSPHNIDDNLNIIVRYGRRYGINCLFASRRTAEINSTIRSQSDFFVSFRQSEPNDLKALKDRSTEKAAKVSSLSIYRDTGKHSEFVVFGYLPDDFLYLNNYEYNATGK